MMAEQTEHYLPYHIDYEKLIGDRKYNKAYADNYHKHDIHGIIRLIYKEPFAFYLTDKDKEHYSEDDLKIIDIVVDIAQKEAH